MKIKVFEAVNICTILGVASTEELGESAEKVTDIFIGLTPLVREYNDALMLLQKDAKGKSAEEAENLTSAKAFEKIANSEREVSIPTLTMAEIKTIGGAIKGFKLANYNLLYPIIQN